MCGIAGFIDFTRQTGKDTLVRMTDVLAHRGPNDAGYEVIEQPGASVGLGQRRLSILDLSSGGHQPMHFRHLSMIFNGEVYNFMEVRKELEARGYTFDSTSDTEVILKGFHCWGASVVDKFIGMFAYVILDREKNVVTVTRDRAGVKPFYYHWDGQTFLFASELKSFHQHGAFRKEIDVNALALFLQFSYIPAPYCIFKHTFKLRPGHILTLSLGDKRVVEQPYWDVSHWYDKPRLRISEQDAMEETERLLVSAYNYRMVADVPVGIFLSGGYDSCSVAGILQKERTERLKTFTIGFHEAGFNEAHYAKKVADFLGTDHHEWYITADDARDVFHRLPDIYDEPFADNSVVPTALVSQLAARHVKVSLSADGGDEIFAGYKKFNQSLRFTESIPAPVQALLSGTMGLINPERIPYFAKQYNFSTRYRKMQAIWGSQSPMEALKLISSYTTAEEVRSFIRPAFTAYETAFDAGYPGASLDSLNRMLSVDYKTFLVDNNLVKVDRATMAVGLEGREPMLDHRVIEFLAQLPADLTIREGVNKYLLKKIVHKYIPKELMDRPKMPFIAPLKVWFRDELAEKMHDYLGERKLRESGLFNAAPITALSKEYLAGSSVNYQKLWNLLVFQLWYERWMKTPVATATPAEGVLA
jgi:asparagine synthase (glutamine-hydrolysing)